MAQVSRGRYHTAQQNLKYLIDFESVLELTAAILIDNRAAADQCVTRSGTSSSTSTRT